MSVFLEKTAPVPFFRILEYFLEARETDHAIADVLDSIAISRSTFYAAWKFLLEQEYVVLSRVVGKTRLYALNAGNVYVQSYLHIFDTALQEQLIEKK